MEDKKLKLQSKLILKTLLFIELEVARINILNTLFVSSNILCF